MTSALLLSGGMDSTCIAWWRRPEIAITVDYGQLPARAEIAASKAICESIGGIRHEIIAVDCSSLGVGDMAGSEPLALSPAPEWWPFRNQLLITLAAMRALRLGASELLIGALESDGARHVDGGGDFIDIMSRVLQMQEGKLTLLAPAITMSAAELVRSSGVPIEILSWSHSCHVANAACGQCPGCVKHYNTLEELGYAPY